MVNVIYSQEKIKTNDNFSIFLAGPSPRTKKVKSWRPKFIKKLKRQIKKDINVFIPEFKKKKFNFEKEKQIEWEQKSMECCDIVIFWIPRKMKIMPGLTTNIEFGYWLGKDPTKILVGIPDNAEKIDYIKYQSKKIGIFYNNKNDLIKELQTKLKKN